MIASRIIGWVAVTLGTLAAGFCAFWGVIEAFHEGWCLPHLWMRLLQVAAYLAPAAMFCALTMVGIRWPRAAAALFALFGVVITVLVLVDQSGIHFSIVAFITALPVVLGLMFLYGRPEPRSVACTIAVGLPAVTVLAFGIEPVLRVSTRFDDGNRGMRLVEDQGFALLWAPAGPGWSRNGNVRWADAMERARHLTEDGLSLADEPQDIWRLPTREEVVRSLTRGDRSAGGTWDSTQEQANYARKPDKESPIWDPHASLIYLWTADDLDAQRAWIVVYHGGTYAKSKSIGSPSFGFRAVRDATRPTWQAAHMHTTDAVAFEAEVYDYGEEQALVDAMTQRNARQADGTYPNDLDHSLSVLFRRAYPRPKEHDLIRGTIDALCGEVEGVTHGTISESRRSAWTEDVERTKSFESVLRNLRAIATEGATQEQLVNVGLPAMLQSTGSAAAAVFSATEAERITNMLEARRAPSEERGMLGLDVSKWPTIQVLPGSPAAEAGLRDGDIVVRINAREVAKTEIAADGLKALTEAADSAISLTIKRAGETITFDVRKASVADRVQASVIGPGIVCIRIPSFEAFGVSERVNELIRKHVTDATSSVILDLRDNVGGRADEANAVADIFLDETYLQFFQFGNGRRIAFKAKPGAVDVQVIILTNRNTGSAAEMLAIALHDNHRATVIGKPTAGALYGKDFEKLSDGRMIVFRSEPTVLSPTGNNYSEAGLPPDIEVDESKVAGEDKTLARAIELIEAVPKLDTLPTATP